MTSVCQEQQLQTITGTLQEDTSHRGASPQSRVHGIRSHAAPPTDIHCVVVVILIITSYHLCFFLHKTKRFLYIINIRSVSKFSVR